MFFFASCRCFKHFICIYRYRYRYIYIDIYMRMYIYIYMCVCVCVYLCVFVFVIVICCECMCWSRRRGEGVKDSNLAADSHRSVPQDNWSLTASSDKANDWRTRERAILDLFSN